MAFTFNAENQNKVKEILAKYPPERKKSAVMPLLDLAQRQNNNWISKEVIAKIAEILEMPEIKVYEVASFYTMYNLNLLANIFYNSAKPRPACFAVLIKLLKLVKKNLEFRWIKPPLMVFLLLEKLNV